jgi:hypothetical protein
VNPEQRRQYRALGDRLSSFVRQQPGGLPSVSALQAVVADLAADQVQLVLPLKELVSRPAFPALAAKAGSGSGAVERQALLQTMEATFTPALVEAVGDILYGFLDLPIAPAAAVKPSEPVSEPFPSKPAPTPQPQEATSVSAPITPTPAPQVSAVAKVKAGFRLLQLLALTFATLLLAAALVVAARSPLLCNVLGLCLVQKASSEASQQVLAAATRAEQDLRSAQTLTDYRKAVAQLENELLKLSGYSLSADQSQQRQQLQNTSTQARAVLLEEAAAETRLNRARQALASAQQASGLERIRHIAAAGHELEGIPSRSFLASEADLLRQQLSAMERQTPEPTPPQPAQAPPEKQEPPTWSPPPTPQPNAGSGSGSGAPYRDQPLF